MPDASHPDDLLPLPELEAAVQRSPGATGPWLDLAKGYCTVEEFGLSAEILTQAMRLAPRDPDIRCRLSMTLIEAGNARAAMPHLHEALRLDVDHFANRSFELGLGFFALAEFAAAAAQFRAATDHSPRMATAWIGLARARSAQGHHVEAIQAFENAIQQHPTSASLWAGLGHAYADTDQHLRAIQAHRLSLRHDPAQPDTLLALGACYERLGRVDEAHGAYRQAERLDPTSTVPLCALAALAVSRHRAQEALIHLRRAVCLDATDADVWCWFAIAHSELGNTLAGLEATRQWARVAPASAVAHLELGTCFREAARHDEAVREFVQALELDPENPIALDELEAQLSLMAPLPDAERVLREALRSQPPHGSLWYNLGRVLNRKLLFEPALSALEQATRLLPDSAPAWRDLGWTYVCFLRNADALAACRKALRLDPADPSTWSLLAHVLDMEHDAEGVREALRYLRHLDPRQARDFQQTRITGRPWAQA